MSGQESEARGALGQAAARPSDGRSRGISGLLHSTPCARERRRAIPSRWKWTARSMPSDDVCTEILRHHARRSRRALGVEVKEAVLTCPATFARDKEGPPCARRSERAGLKVAAFVEEPVAGGLAYGMRQDKNEIVAVYDFGGGTFDFSVIDFSGDRHRWCWPRPATPGWEATTSTRCWHRRQPTGSGRTRTSSCASAWWNGSGWCWPARD